MNVFSKEIPKELLPAKADAAGRAAASDAVPENPVAHWTPAALLERAASLREPANEGGGSASETLCAYPRHSVMLSFRGCDGVVEVHENFADVFYVLDGCATLLTGGAVLEAAVIGPGEMRGSSMVGGARQDLRPGDVAHISAGVPHQMLVAKGQTITSLVLKIPDGHS